MSDTRKAILAYFFFLNPFLGDESKELPDIVKGQWALKKMPTKHLRHVD